MTDILPHMSEVRAEHSAGRQLWQTIQLAAIRCFGNSRVVAASAAPFGLTFQGRIGDCIARHIYRSGCHEPILTRYVMSHVHLRAGDVALDVGANIGWYSLLLDRLAEPGASIFAFEPDPDNFAFLTRNLSANHGTKVEAVQLAAGAEPGVGVLNRYKNCNAGRHTLMVSGNFEGGKVSVPVTTLEQFWEERGLGERPLRFLKIDVEGYEYFVMRGAATVLQRCPCVSLEFSPSSMRESGLDPADLIALIADAGFTVRYWAGEMLACADLGQLREVEGTYELLLLRE